jgi:hypothetical protein
MKRGPLFFLLILSALTSGCVTFKEGELDTIRACRVSPAVYRKLVDREVVTPPDIVELWQKRVPPGLIVKQLDKVGVDYALRQADVAMLDRAGVSPGVLEALSAASDRYVSRYAPPEFFDAHDLQSGEYLVTPPIRSSGSLLWGPDVLQR